MNLLVTGAAGFIGSHYVLRHAARHPDNTIVVVDSLTYAADRRFLAPAEDRITFVKGDIVDFDLLHDLVGRHGIDAVVNFAAETHVDRSIQNAVPFIHSNILGVHSLIELCKRRKNLLLLHVSTDEVYGDLRDGDPPCGPDGSLRPSSPYAASKAAGDLLLLAAARTFGIRVRITRCTNNYGPHQDRSKFLPVVISRALRDQPIPVYGKGQNKRDWLYVTDHTDAIECVLEQGKDGEVYCIGADDERRNVDVAKTVLAILQKPDTLIQFVPDRPGHDWRYALDSAGTRALGWKPQVSFTEGVARTVAWFREKAGDAEGEGA